MWTVAEYEIIRRKVKVEGLSQRKTANELGHSRKMVAKALKYSMPPGYRRKKEVKYPVLGEYIGIIDAWLENDRKMPRKQRHTAQRIYERLKEEYGYMGGYDSIQRYVKKRKERTGEKYFPLEFSPAEEAQVDWGEGFYYKNGEKTKGHVFHMRMCYSKAAFTVCYERENLESFMAAHVQAFEYFGGVPGRIAYDNLKSAVIQVGRSKERKLNRRFIELRSHYLFESRFCNIGKGNEKGTVENQVKRMQRTYMTPLPEVMSLKELNQHLLENCRRDLKKKDQRSGKKREELFEEEKRLFLELPEVKFEACKRASTFVNNKSLVRYDHNNYSVPVNKALHAVRLKVFANRIEIYTEGEKIAEHTRSYERKGYVLDYLHYIELLRKKPSGIFNAIPFKGQPWGRDLEIMRNELEYKYGYGGTKKFINILLLFKDNDIERVKDAVRKCISTGAYDDTAVRSVLCYKPRVKIGTIDLSERPELTGVGTGKRELSIYDRLIQKEI